MTMTGRDCKGEIADAKKYRRKNLIWGVAVAILLFFIFCGFVLYFFVFPIIGENHCPHKTVIQKQCVEEKIGEREQEEKETAEW